MDAGDGIVEVVSIARSRGKFEGTAEVGLQLVGPSILELHVDIGESIFIPPSAKGVGIAVASEHIKRSLIIKLAMT